MVEPTVAGGAGTWSVLPRGGVPVEVEWDMGEKKSLNYGRRLADEKSGHARKRYEAQNGSITYKCFVFGL